MNKNKTIIIATIKEWNISNYFKLKDKYSNKFNFHLITDKTELTQEYLSKLSPKYIFFLHWSWIIPDKIYKNFECVVFHMTDLPYGRGGSPLQNLIMNEVYQTKISAIKVTKELDAGDIYMKEDLDISIGSAEEIFEKASRITIEKMIPKFLEADLSAHKQEGEVVTFKRRNPSQSNLLNQDSISMHKLYNLIRMLDAQGYPKAFIQIENYKIELSKANFENGILSGSFEVKEDE